MTRRRSSRQLQRIALWVVGLLALYLAVTYSDHAARLANQVRQAVDTFLDPDTPAIPE